MAPIQRNNTPGAIVVRRPGGALVRTGAATPPPVKWVQRIQTGVVDTVRRAIPLSGAFRGAALGQAFWAGLNAPPVADGTLDAARRRGDMGVTRGGGRSIGSLPAEARVPSQYPAGVPTGIGGGNAGASATPPSRVSGSQSRSGGGGFNYQPPTPTTPGMSNVARPVTGRGGRERAYTAMVQQAGLTQEQANAARARGEAALAQRKAGLMGGELSGKLDPSQHEYWEQADIKAWAAVPAHKAMVDRLKAKHGYVSPEDQVKSITTDVARNYEAMKPMLNQAYTQGQDSVRLMTGPQIQHGFNPGAVDVDPAVFQESLNPMEEILSRHLERAKEVPLMQAPASEAGMTPEEYEEFVKRSWTMNRVGQ